MSIVAVVPARGGSKAIPRKNLALLGGRPLLSYTADAVHGSGLVDRTILSTDDEEIAAVGRMLGLEVPFLRPPELALDASLMIDVLRHTLEWLELTPVPQVEALVLLQPTSPFRSAQHVDEAINLFREHDADSVVSVMEVPHQFAPSSLMRMDAGRVTPYLQAGPGPLLRQAKARLWARNGPAILVLKPTTVRAGKLYTERTYGYPMDRRSSIDIDGPEDLELAELLLSSRSA